MTKWSEPLWRELRRLHRSEKGAVKIEYLLIIAAISLPLLLVLTFYGKTIMDWLANQWQTVTGSPITPTQPPTPPTS